MNLRPKTSIHCSTCTLRVIVDASFCATDAIFLCKRNKNCSTQRQIDGPLRMINNSGSNVFTTGGWAADQSEDASKTSQTSITLGA
ncbi:hypothetical protein NPIL_662001 [Nephila pilipes]|uniref:Uncharacterized protein n=1 Tax=Nephila pilipes TaxID=299642 RepID=A0A8X6TWJ1_NEPPI|nr:hypothetical protein NPIL_662001 [Nephila pilipes]